MTYTFRYRTGFVPDIVEGEYVCDAACLTFAVTEFTESFYSKHFRSF